MLIIFLFLILVWLLLTPFELQVDTRIPQVSLRWISIGRATAFYDNERWTIRLRVLFVNKQWDLEELIFANKKKRRARKRTAKQRKQGMGKFRKFLNVIKSFQMTECKVAIDTEDSLRNAWLFPLNFLPTTQEYCWVNFIDENYLVLRIRNAPWKVAYAFLK